MELSIDTASELASVALSQEGALVAECTWRCRRNHSVELLPSVDRLLAQASVDKTSLSAIFVSTGPGMYTGLRVGIATAKGLARALGLPLVGVGRLELEAYAHSAFPGTVPLKPGTLTAVYTDIMEELHAQGFRRMLVLNGHGGNTNALTAALSVLVRKMDDLRIKVHHWWMIPPVPDEA